MRRKKTEAEVKEELDEAFKASEDHITTMARVYARQADLDAKQRARDESLRIALITNEINAGRISEIAGLYRTFLLKQGRALNGDERAYCPTSHIKALEHAAKIGYVSAEETVEAAKEFAKHLSGENERSQP